MKRILVLLATMVAGVLLASGVALAAVVSEVEPNQPLAQAQALAAASFDLTANTDIADSTTVPHATVNGSGDATLDYYSFTVPAGDPVRVILDIDHTSIVTPPPGAFYYDSWIELYNSSGTRLAASDDNGGDPGSSSGLFLDSRIEEILDPGTYYVAVGRLKIDDSGFHMAEVPDTATYELHVSLGNVPVPDTTAPSVSCSVTPSKLSTSANNHKLVTITAGVSVTDSGGSGTDPISTKRFTLVSVTSNQAQSGLGPGDVANDIQGWSPGTPDTSGQLRAERYGGSRVYTLTYQGKDLAGNTKDCQATVTVPKGG